MTTLNISFDSDRRFPLLCKYDGQHKNQPAYVTLDLETGECTAGYSGEIGNAVPESVWNNRVLRFPVSEYLTTDRIKEILESAKDDLQYILEYSEIIWNGSDYVGRLTNDKARELVARYLNENPWNISEVSINVIESISELFVHDDQYPDSVDGMDKFVQDILDDQSPSEWVFSDDLNDFYSLKSALLEYYADDVYAGHELPQHVAQILIKEGTCKDSQWMDELQEMATQGD